MITNNQQLMEIAGVDYPESRWNASEVVYMLQSLTKNHRVIVKCATDEDTPVADRHNAVAQCGLAGTRRCSTCMGSPSQATLTCAAFLQTTASKGTPSARISR